MFPWVYGFEWKPGYLAFLGIFFLVASTVLTTVAIALLRSARDLNRRRAEEIQWHSEFEDLLPNDRVCRHNDRTCEQGFDCRRCVRHNSMVRPTPVLPGERLYHRGHTVVEVLEHGIAQVGLDDIGSALIGPPDWILLPAPGTKVQANGTAWKVRRNGREFRVRSPIDGEVIETNAAGSGWVMRIRPREPFDVRHLLRGHEADEWQEREMDRLQLMASEMCGAPALGDGGELMDDLSTQFRPHEWESMTSRMLLDD